MKVLFLTGREIGYQRNEVLLRAFQRFSEVDVLSAKIRPKSILVNSLRIILQSLPRISSGKYDLIFIGFYGHLLILPTSLLGRAPVLFDAFISTYDTLIEDRKIGKRDSLLAHSSIWLDRVSCQLADLVLLDTQKHIDYFVSALDFGYEKFRSIPVGCNEDIFFPRSILHSEDEIRVIYYTSYLPLHGVDVVIRAAEKLANAPVCFRLIGSGIMFKEAIKTANRLGLRNVKFIPPIQIGDIADEIAKSDICLGGHFGASEKAGRVVPGKIYQILAMKKPVIASSTPANVDLLVHDESALLCPQKDPDSLAEAIIEMARDYNLRERLAVNGNNMYKETCSEEKITARLRTIVDELV